MAAARGDQVAEAANSKQPTALKHQASDIAPSQAAVTHTPAPDRPPQGSAERVASTEEAAAPSMMHMNSSAAAAVVTDKSLSSSGSQTGTSSESQASDSPSLGDEAQSPPAGQAHTDAHQGTAVSAEAVDYVTDQQQLPERQDLTDQPMTDSAADSGGDAMTHAHDVTGRTEGRSARSARIPLAAVQEAVTPILSSLSFKQAHLQAKQGDSKPCHLSLTSFCCRDKNQTSVQYSMYALAILDKPLPYLILTTKQDHVVIMTPIRHTAVWNDEARSSTEHTNTFCHAVTANQIYRQGKS